MPGSDLLRSNLGRPAGYRFRPVDLATAQGALSFQDLSGRGALALDK